MPIDAVATTPSVTVIMPTYNRRDVVVACLAALERQTVDPSSFDVIVIDDGSSDGTGEAVRDVLPRWQGRLVYLRQDNAGANAARNAGIAQARGDLLVIINDDSIGVPEFIAAHLRSHRDHPGESVAVLGRMTVSPDIPRSPVEALHLDASYAPFAGKTELDWTAFLTCNVSVKRSFLLRCGLFDTGLRWHEDIELGQRLRHHGLKVIYNPKALAYHLHYLSEADLVRMGEKEGQALAAWYRRQPVLRDTLVDIGLRTRSFPQFSVRYLVADLLVNDRTIGLWLGLAAAIRAISQSTSLRIYAAIFQSRKRRAITRGLDQAA